MAQASIPVDLFNPGQVFACLGLLEWADQLLGDARGGFDWSEPTAERFHLSAPGDTNPVAVVLAALANARVVAVSPDAAALSTEKWAVPTVGDPRHREFPIKRPDSPATLPVRLDFEYAGQTRHLTIDHWGDATERDNVKFWAGSGGYPGAALFRDALDLVRSELSTASDDPFAVSQPQSSSFRLDWRRDYIPLDAGFSPNVHGNVVMTGFPIVEMLAAIGLTHARPRRSPRDKLEYRYAVLGVDADTPLYQPLFLRAALGGTDLGFPRRQFLMQLGWPGQENQARCITNVIEETKG
ncbi:MAG: type I-U CRISPR-associated protein Cas8c [Chromatiales bacterium]|nr:type I-U CRISPR-associated protein Cas8c [Chromatiales bacterium]